MALSSPTSLLPPPLLTPLPLTPNPHPCPPPRGAALYFTSYWGVGLPTGLALGFWAGWGALGLWMGVAIATALQAVAVHLWVALRLDWRAEVARSQSTIEALLDCHAAGAGGGGAFGGGEQEEEDGACAQDDGTIGGGEDGLAQPLLPANRAP